MYKLVDSVDNSLYEVYCHFESGIAWTLVLSNSYKTSSYELKISLSRNWPMNGNALAWSSYRLRETRMQSIKGNSTFIQLSCDFEKHYDIQKLDHVQMPLESFENGTIADILGIENDYTSYADIRDFGIYNATGSTTRGPNFSSKMSAKHFDAIKCNNKSLKVF